MEYKFTLSDAIQRINMNLNYPAITFEDVSSFFDMAIADLNTSLHTEIKSVSNMIKEFRHYTSKNINRILLTSEPDSSTVIEERESEELANMNATLTYYYNTTTKLYGTKLGTTWTYSPTLYGVYNKMGTPYFYKAVRYGTNATFWITDATDNPLELNLLEYLSEDWITLYLIPYVCFKYSCRDGGTANVFAEEYTQGFQQLQNAYDVKENVLLATYAGKLAYVEDVEKHLPYLNVLVPTRGIYKEMKHDRAVVAQFGGVYDRGGWL